MTPKHSISKYNHILRFQGARLLGDTSQPSALLLPGNYNLRFLKWGLTTALTLQTCNTMPRECGSHVQPMEPGPESSPSDFETEALTCQWEDSGSGSGQPGWTRGCRCPLGSRDNLCMSKAALFPGAPWPAMPILPEPEAAPGCWASLCANSSRKWGASSLLPKREGTSLRFGEDR